MKKSKQVVLSAVFLALATSVAACGSDDNGRRYCGDSQGRVIDEDDCDGDNDPSGTFIYMGSYPYYNRGDVIDGTKTQHKISSTDQTARSRVGIPARGGFGGNGSKFSTGG